MSAHTKDVLISIRLPRALVQALDDYRRESEDLPSRPEAIRRCLVGQLQQAGYPVDKGVEHGQ